MTGGSAGVGLATTPVHDRMDPAWPPVLVVLVLVVLIGGVIIITMMFRRFRAAARGDRFDAGSRRR